MENKIPDWVIEYNNANYQSSAGKAVKLLLAKVSEQENEIERLEGLITSTPLSLRNINYQQAKQIEQLRNQLEGVSEQSQSIEALTKENEQYKDAIKSRNILQEEDQTKIRELTEQVEKLKAFKEYVHGRFDDMSIPVDPESPHKLAGCRIGGRIDFIDAKLSRLREERKELVEALRQLWGFSPDIPVPTTNFEINLAEAIKRAGSLLSKFEVPNQS